MKVFISSLITGMEAERAAAERAVKLLGHEPLMAEQFGAKATSPQIMCLDALRKADLVILILGPRYGAKQQSGLSATHEEVREAQNRKPILPFVSADEPEPEQAKLIEEVGGWTGGLAWGPFSSPQELGDQITGALHKYEVSHATGPVDPAELKARALALMPENTRDTSESTLCLALAAGPTQSVLRPAQMEDPELAAVLEQKALFGPLQLFDRTRGTQAGLEDGALVVQQQGRHYGRSDWVALWETGDMLIQLQVQQPSEGRGFPVVIEEEVAQQLARAIAYATWLLSHVDPTERLTHVLLAARLSGSSAYGWRTRSEHAASPNSGSVMGFGREEDRQRPVLLTPAHQSRQALTMDAPRIAQDLLVLLRRQWKQP